ncbi:MAG: CAP domain-containing protein [Candidatus Aureabacteria bacterium]|nr:CAP domain-containing protein [Candidatus Auribacterota bacterium]
MRSYVRFIITIAALFACSLCFSEPASHDTPPVDLSCPLSLREEIIKEINLARKDPKAYAAFLKEFKKFYDGNKMKRSGKKIIMTKEGVKVVEEAITYLKSLDPLPLLKLSNGMSLAAKDHIDEISGTSLTGHVGSAGSLPGDRVNRFGTWSDAIGENICYGFDSPREIVIWMIIDDGFASRGHRVNIFRPEFHFAGAWVCRHPLYDFMCVITFAGKFEEKNK